MLEYCDGRQDDLFILYFDLNTRKLDSVQLIGFT